MKLASDFEKLLGEIAANFLPIEGHNNTCTIPLGTSNYSNQNLFHGQMPIRILVAFVAAKNYNGNLNHNPYYFHHYDVESFKLLKNGREYPIPEIKTQFDDDHPLEFIDAYHKMMQSFASEYNDHTVNITPEEFANGYFFYSYYMPPSQEQGSDPHMVRSLQTAQISVEVRFAKPLDEAIQMLIYYESLTSIHLDNLRRVTVEHL